MPERSLASRNPLVHTCGVRYDCVDRPGGFRATERKSEEVHPLTESNYSRVYKRSLDDPSGWWGEIAEGIDGYKKWGTVLDASAKPAARWFSGGILNTRYNAMIAMW